MLPVSHRLLRLLLPEGVVPVLRVPGADFVNQFRAKKFCVDSKTKYDPKRQKKMI
jgi:hypothetical protein